MRAGLVTGGSSGIGKALARALGQEGYAVTISGRDEGKLAGAAEELRGEGIVVEAVGADMADEAAIEALVAAHRRRSGGWMRSSIRRPTGPRACGSRSCRPTCWTTTSTSTCARCS